MVSTQSPIQWALRFCLGVNRPRCEVYIYHSPAACAVVKSVIYLFIYLFIFINNQKEYNLKLMWWLY